jgi:pimeloyl-ACP methyl ester carboxylesterase
LLVMIHGLASNLTRWSEFVDQTTLNRSWDLMRIDLRGHGTSMHRGRIGMELWCDDLAAILKQEHYAKATIVGHSLGAQVGFHFQAKHPSAVTSMIAIDPIFPENLSGHLLKAKRMRVLVWLAIRKLWVLNFLGFRRRRFPPRDLHALDEQTRATLADNPDLKIGDLYTNPFVDLEFLPVANYLQDLLEATRPLPPLNRITANVLVLLSAGASVSDAERNRATIARIPKAETVTIAANHWLLTEKPREAREAIESWCQGLARRDHPDKGLPDRSRAQIS